MQEQQQLGRGAAMDFYEGGESDQPPPKGYLKRRITTKNSKSTLIKMGDDDDALVNLEVEAYKAVVRAFGAQSEQISWEKERVMTNLRKELRVTDQQHRDILEALVGDETIAKLRAFKSDNTAPAPEPPEPPKRKAGPGRPKGSKKKKTTDDNQAASGLQRPKPKKVQQLSSFVKPEEEFQLLSIDDIEAQTDQVEGDAGKADSLTRIMSLLKAAEDHKRKILEEMAQCGLENDGVDKMQVDGREHDEDLKPANHDMERHDDDDHDDRDDGERVQIDSEETATAVKDEG